LEKASATSRTISTPPTKVFMSVFVVLGKNPGVEGEPKSRPAARLYLPRVGERAIAESLKTPTVFEMTDEWGEGTLSMPSPNAGVHLCPESTTKLFVIWTGSWMGVGREL
jgi:hypothetical protein